MPKMKTHKGIKKRVRLSAKGKVRHRRANTGHLMSSKSGNRRRFLRKKGVMSSAIGDRMREALGKYGS